MRKQHDIYRYIWRLWQGFHRNETNSAQQINYSTCKSQELKFSHPHQLQEQKNFSFVTLSFHIARNKNSFSRCDGVKPVLAAGRFSLFASLYLLTCIRWKFRNGTKTNWGRKTFSSESNSNSICPLKIKLNLYMYWREGKFWRHELHCGFPSYYSAQVKEKKYSLLFTMVLDGKRLSG